jgi:uncharacterized protein GlcG (DUF336 family)
MIGKKMNKKINKLLSSSFVVASLFAASSAQAACSDFSAATLKSALDTVVSGNTSAGFNLPMWLSFVDETGVVCAVVTSGNSGAQSNPGVTVGRDKWLGSRVISTQKANTANAFSLNGVSISSGALYAAVQPGASLYGLQESNPVDAAKAYAGAAALFGTGATDPMVGERIGGVNVFGGGLAVYTGGKKRGAIGVSGDTSCTDHAVAWQVRTAISGDPSYANFPSGGGFERLTITGTYANLGDHPDCPLSSGLAHNATAGYN